MTVNVILDTDIGTDIDDAWALAMLLASPELTLSHVVSAHADTRYRARIAARMLDQAGRADVVVGVGKVTGPLDRFPQLAYVEGYELDDYPGTVEMDGVQTLIDAVMQHDQSVVLSIGPATNIAAALEREPGIAQRARFVGMHGGIRTGYKGSTTPVPEYNVYCDVEAFRRVLAAPWSVTLTPLDTCGLVYLSGDNYAAVRDSQSGLAAAVMANYRAWAAAVEAPADLVERRSTTLYDTVAVLLAFGDDPFLEMEDVGIDVTDEGLTAESASGRQVSAALRWRDLEGFNRFLVERLLADSVNV